MRKRDYIALILVCYGLAPAFGQQDPMFTNYQFNGLVFNPAYAGSNEHLTLNLIHRQQWLGFDGAPVSQSLIAHTPLKNERVGVGFNMVNDKIGPTRTFKVAGSYAYRIIVGKKKNMKLSAGLQASAANWRGDWSDLTVEVSDDPSFEQNVSRWLPNFGVGLYLSGKRFYAGLGCPQLLENDLRQAKSGDIPFYGKSYRHWYAALGGIVPIDGDQLIFRPSMLLRGVGLFSSFKDDDKIQNIGSPTALNLDAAFLFRQTFWVGASFRTAVQAKKSSSDSADLWVAINLRNGLRLGVSYDMTLSQLQQAAGSSIELMAGYEFDIKVKKVASPRYF